MWNLDPIQRLVLWNQYEILKHVNPDQSATYEAKQEVLQAGWEALYDQTFPHFEEKPFPHHRSKFVFDVLDMFDALDRFEKKTGKPLDSRSAKFLGFDGHKDLVGFTRYVVEIQGRWNWLNITQFDAHFPVEQAYERMLSVWFDIPVSDRFDLNSKQAEEVVAAAVHPENRGTG